MKKRIILVVVIVAVLAVTIALLAGFISGGQGTQTSGLTVRTMPLVKMDLSSSVSATGSIYSTDVTNVYSSLNYIVKTVNVSVGDKVSEGDILAELDISGLEMDIAQKKASLSSSQATAYQNLTTARNDLATYQKDLGNSNNTNLLNAETALKTAQLDLDSAGNDLVAARRDLRDARADSGDNDGDDNPDLRKLIETEKARDINYEKAKENLAKAKKNLEIAKNNTTNDIQSYENKVKSAEINANFDDQLISLQKLEADLEKTIIKSPVSGTVTAVMATEGASGSGLLFVIQDEAHLKVVTTIKEYDINTVTLGDRVTIKSDSTGDEVFEGVLSKIAPTSSTTAKGETQSTTDAEFQSEIQVNSGARGLKIGMNARLSIITEESRDVYAVPYDSIGTNELGESIIYVAEPIEDGKLVARVVPVTTGLETDIYVQISGDLRDGMIVIKDIDGIYDGAAVNMQVGEVPASAQNGNAQAYGGQGMAGGPGVRVGMIG